MALLEILEDRVSERIVDLVAPEIRLQKRFARSKKHHPVHGLIKREYVPSLMSLVVRRKILIPALSAERGIKTLVEVKPVIAARKGRDALRSWATTARQAFSRDNITDYAHDIRAHVGTVPRRVWDAARVYRIF